MLQIIDNEGNSFTVDHRIVDGGEATRFLTKVMEYLADPVSLIMAKKAPDGMNRMAQSENEGFSKIILIP